LKAAHRLGLRVPEDLAVVGFDDLTLAAMTQPPLTTVAQPRTEVGVRAGHLLIDRIEGLGSAARHIVLPTHLVVRESCGAKMHIRDGVQAGT
jgi:DNA-binding LacI/PurR family transcriptional regulator